MSIQSITTIYTDIINEIPKSEYLQDNISMQTKINNILHYANTTFKSKFPTSKSLANNYTTNCSLTGNMNKMDIIMRAILSLIWRSNPSKKLDPTSENMHFMLIIALQDITSTSLQMSDATLISTILHNNFNTPYQQSEIVISSIMTNLPADIRNNLSLEFRQKMQDYINTQLSNSNKENFNNNYYNYNDNGNYYRYNSNMNNMNNIAENNRMNQYKLDKKLDKMLRDARLDATTINGMNENLRNELKTDFMIDTTLYEILSPQIEKDISNEVILPQNLDYINMVKVSGSVELPDITKPEKTIPIIKSENIATYVDQPSEILLGVDKQYYYFDKLSGTLSELPNSIDKSASIPISRDELDEMMKSNKISMEEIPAYIQNLINKKNGVNNDDSTDSTDSDDSTKKKIILIVGIVMSVLILIGIVIGIAIYSRRNT